MAFLPSFEEKAGDADRVSTAGEAGGFIRDGEAGRARREGMDNAGDAGRGMPPMRDAGLGTPEGNRDAVGPADDGADVVSAWSTLLGPATRLSRSSSCVLSFGFKEPT